MRIEAFDKAIETFEKNTGKRPTVIQATEEALSKVTELDFSFQRYNKKKLLYDGIEIEIV